MITTSRLRPYTRWTVALCTALLAACGGGGYGGGGGGGGGGCGAYSSCAPTVMITNAAGTVRGTVTLAATATAAGTYTVMNVQFKVDGTAVGAADTTAPYSYDWNSTTVANGTHMISATVTDSVGQMATSANVTLTVSNPVAVPVTLTAGLLFPAVATAATGSGGFTITANGGMSGSVTLSDITASSAEIGDAYAGASSAALFALTQNAGNANEWDVPASTNLDSGQRADLAAGKLYVLVRSAANPHGELRAQLLPSGFSIKVAALTGGAEVPAVVSSGSGMVAVTVDRAGMMAAVHVNVSGISATGAEMDTGAAGMVGSTLAPLAVDALNPNHYFNDAVTLTGADVSNYMNGMWYANVFSAAHVSGASRGQLVNAL